MRRLERNYEELERVRRESFQLKAKQRQRASKIETGIEKLICLKTAELEDLHNLKRDIKMKREEEKKLGSEMITKVLTKVEDSARVKNLLKLQERELKEKVEANLIQLDKSNLYFEREFRNNRYCSKDLRTVYMRGLEQIKFVDQEKKVGLLKETL